MFKMSVSPQAGPDKSTFVKVEFEKGCRRKLTNETDGTVKVRENSGAGGGGCGPSRLSGGAAAGGVLQWAMAILVVVSNQWSLDLGGWWIVVSDRRVRNLCGQVNGCIRPRLASASAVGKHVILISCQVNRVFRLDSRGLF